MIRLANTESSLEAVEKVIGTNSRKQSVKLGDAKRKIGENEKMDNDREDGPQLGWEQDGESHTVEKRYVPKGKLSSVHVNFQAPTGTKMFGAFSSLPGTFLVDKVEVLDSDGVHLKAQFEIAPDLPVNRKGSLMLWTIPRSGHHFTFDLPAGGVSCVATFSATVNPIEMSRISTESWKELAMLRQRVAELEQAARAGSWKRR